MRIRLIASLLAIPAIPALCGAQQKVDIRRATTPTVSVRLGGAMSQVRVIGWDRDSVVITGSLGVGSRMDGGALNTPGPVQGIKFFIDAPDDAALANNVIELRVPRDARVWIKAGSAQVDASGVTGGLDLNIVGGSVKANGQPRELIVESMDGAVTFRGTAQFARLKTATGDITLDGGGEDVSLSTVSGVIRAAGGAVERGRFESVTGPINFAADLARGGDVRFDTHSGAIDVRFAKGAAVEVDAQTVTGAIENAWTKTRPGIGREGRGMELGTSSGMGGARVSIRSFKGNVRLATR